jgi:pimeloyl-ACP methyl ester carboxylesterase
MLRDLALWTLGVGVAVALAIGVGAWVYTAVSFLFARRHLPPRPLRATAVEVMREAFLAMLVTPLLPLYALIGHRMGGPRHGTPIVLVHGYTQNRANFVSIARALTRAAIGPVYGFNYWSLSDVRRSARRLDRFIQKVCREADADSVDLVCHSMGGLVAVELILRAPARVRRCVTIASPHRGVVWSGPLVGKGAAQLRAGRSSLIDEHEASILGVPLLSIASAHDNVVHPPDRTSVAHRGGQDLVVEGPGHLAILFDPRVIDETVRFLREAEV